MEIYLFYLLNASNDPLILFDQIIDWLKRYKGNIIQNDALKKNVRRSFRV